MFCGRYGCGLYGLCQIWIFRVADMVFGCVRYRFAVADIVVADMVCGQYGRTPI